MKPVKFTLDKVNGLWLDKQTISKLQESQLANIKGGTSAPIESCLADSCIKSCQQNSCNSKAAA